MNVEMIGGDLMKHTVITIGRSYGSGGHEVGARLAAKLGIPFYDKKLLELAAEKTGYCEDFIKHNDEKTPGVFARSINFSRGSGYTQPSSEDTIFVHQSQIIKELAEKESCVIVGRCADFVLRDRKDTVNLFIYASLDDRIQRKLALSDDKKNEAQIKKEIVSADKKRERYYNFYTGAKWGNSMNYHLCIDTSLVGVDGAVDLIVEFIDKIGHHDIMPD